MSICRYSEEDSRIFVLQTFPLYLFLLSDAQILVYISLNFIYCSHKTEQHIEKLAKETLARLKAVSDTDYGNEVFASFRKF